jgi:hypothetical protein
LEHPTVVHAENFRESHDFRILYLSNDREDMKNERIGNAFDGERVADADGSGLGGDRDFVTPHHTRDRECTVESQIAEF